MAYQKVGWNKLLLIFHHVHQGGADHMSAPPHIRANYIFKSGEVPVGTEEMFAMFKQFKCTDGTVVAKDTVSDEILVDDVISFLEHYRGKQFRNGAAGDTCFIASEELVSTDSFGWWYEHHEYEDEADLARDELRGY